MDNGTAHEEVERRRQEFQRDATWEQILDDSNRGYAAHVFADAQAQRAEAETARLQEKRLAMIEKRLADLEAQMKKGDDAE